MKRLLATICVSAVSAVSAVACAPVDSRTQITLALESETEIPKELDSFAVRVTSTRTGELRFSQDYYPSSGRDFPTTLAVIPLDEDSLESPLRIEIEGRKGSVTFLRRQSIVGYLKDRNVLLRMPLRMACFQFTSCGPNATCAGGQCVDARVDPASLRDYDEGVVFGRPGACFDEEQCLDASAELEIATDCTFAIPRGVARDRGNVAIRWAAAPGRILGLDSDDAVEGWTRISDERGKLSQGACDSHFQRRSAEGTLLVADWAKNVYFTGTCASKTALTPYCFSARTQHAGIGVVSP